MRKLLSDVIRVLLDKSGVDRDKAKRLASYIESADQKGYKGMFEAVIESIIEGREEVREETREEIIRNALAKGHSPETIHDITGLDMEIIKGVAKVMTNEQQ